MSDINWYELKNSSKISSPSLLVSPDLITANIRLMLSVAEDVSKLRPHIKTHKMAEIIKLQQKQGIQKFKCATIAEAELLGQCKAKDVLVAMQLVGANQDRFLKLMNAYPETKFSALIDNQNTLKEFTEKAVIADKVISLYIDVNNGMNRTGCLPDERAVVLFTAIVKNKAAVAEGLHVYDGHIRNTDITERKKVCDAAFDSVLRLKQDIEDSGFEVKNIVAGGSPSFPIHAKRPNVETSPGTTLLWDIRYGELFPDMPFHHAAVLLMRIISKPEKDIICFDLGHKAVAPEMGFPRVRILGLEDSEQIGQSEEHLVVKTRRASEFQVGDTFYAIPMHICPTVAKYDEVYTVTDGEVTGFWKVAAQNRKITI